MADSTLRPDQQGAPDGRAASPDQPAAGSAPVPPAGFVPSPVPGAPVSTGEATPAARPERPVPAGAPVAPDARRPEDDAPRSAFETARAAVESTPGLGDVNVSQLDAIAPGPHRASPLSFIPTSFKIIPSFLAIIVVWVFQLPKAFERSDGAMMPLLLTVLVIVALLVLAAIIALVSWRIHTWELEDDALVLRKKFVTSTEKRIPYQRVHSIDLNAGLFSRLLGLVDVSVDTGTGVADKIDGLKRSDAEVLKRTVFARKELQGKAAAARDGVPAPAGMGAPVDSAAPVEPQPVASAAPDDILTSDHVDHETRLTRRQYVLGALTSPNINGLIVSLVGFVAGLFSLLEYAADIFGEQVIYGLLGSGVEITVDSAADMASGIDLGFVAVIVGVLLIVLLVVWVASAVLSLVKWGNFVARRRGDRVEVSWGLLSRSTRAVELGRVQYISVEQSLIRRVTGYARIVAHTVSVSSGEDAGSLEAGVVIHPFIKLSEVDAWLADMLPEFSGIVGAASDLDRLPLPALRRTLLHGLYWALACAVPAVIPTILRATDVMVVTGSAAWLVDAGIATLWVLAAFVLVWGEFVRVLAWRHRRIGTSGRLFALRDGALGSTISATPRTKVQALNVSQSPFQRGAGVGTVRVNTAGAGGDLRMRDAGTSTTDGLLDWARPRYHNEEQVARALTDAGLM